MNRQVTYMAVIWVLPYDTMSVQAGIQRPHITIPTSSSTIIPETFPFLKKGD